MNRLFSSALILGCLSALAAEPDKKTDAKPPYERYLKAEDAKKAADLLKEIDRLATSDKYEDALKLDEQLLELRIKGQGADHWEVINQKWTIDADMKVVALSAEKRAAWQLAQKDRAAAQSFENEGRYAEAQPRRQAYLKQCIEVLGEDHPFTLACYGALGSGQDELGKHVEAETILRKTLAGQLKNLGEDHPLISTTYTSLGFALYQQGKIADAEQPLYQALKIRRKVIGDEHSLTADSFSNLASVIEAQGRATEAESLFRKALAIREKVLGPEHPDTARLYNNVATSLDAQGRSTEAEPLYRKALAVYIKVLGAEHLMTAAGYNNIAYNLNAQGRAAEAEPLYQKALAIYVKTLGPEHPETASLYNNVAGNLDSLGKAAEAEPLLRKSLAIRLKFVGEDHPETALLFNNVAGNLHSQGKEAEAEPFFRKALEICQKLLGEQHPDTARGCSNLAANLDSQGKWAEAEPLHLKALTIRIKVRGAEHPETADSYNNLASHMNDRGRPAEAETLYRKALEISRKTRGEEHSHTAAGYNNVGYNLSAQGKPAEAEPPFRKALAIRLKILGEQHPGTAESYNNLAANLYDQSKVAEAGELLEQCVHTYEAARLAIAMKGLDRAGFGRSNSPYRLLAGVQLLRNKPAAAWAALEADLARGLLDEMGAQAGAKLTASHEARRLEMSQKLQSIQPRLLRLVSAVKRSPAEQSQMESLLSERTQLADGLGKLAAEISQRELANLAQVQAALTGDAAWIAWLDLSDRSGNSRGHWACVMRATGDPEWEQLPGSGPDSKWTKDDDTLASRLREELAKSAPQGAAIADLYKQLRTQRLAPVEKHLQGIKRLYAVPVNQMAGIPIEVMLDQYTVSYVPSATFLARLKGKATPTGSGLMALGDPIFESSAAKPARAELPPGGLLVLQVVPGGAAAKSGLRPGDVLVGYAGTELATYEQLSKLVDANAAAASVEINVWRAGDNKIKVRDVAPGKLGIVLDKRPAREALADRRKTDALVAMHGVDLTELPGTRIELNNLAKIFGKSATILADSDASEQKLEELRTSGALAKFRYLHFGTHGEANNAKSFESVLYLAQDKLPKELVSEPDKPFINGQLSAREVLEHWKVDAELVTLSACETALGRQGGGDGLLGFAQAFLNSGARSVCLSLWKVDDTATALLMDRFYRNLLGKREGLTQPMPKAEALAEAKNWLRNLGFDDAAKLTAQMTSGVVRGKDQKALRIATPAQPEPKGNLKPFADPKYWAAFILIGDPN